MVRVLLVNQAKIPHYRVPIYGYLAKYLGRYGFELTVASAGVEPGNPHIIEFNYEDMPLNITNILKFIIRERIEIVIFWVNLKYLYLFPVCFILKFILRRKIVYWGHGRDLLDKKARLKNVCYAVQHVMADAIVLYAEHLKQYVIPFFHKKTFVANNTLCISYKGFESGVTREDILAQYGIRTKKNIICVGRMQKRKRIENLVEAVIEIGREDIGLILVGPDPEGVLNEIDGSNIYKLGPIYGDTKFDLLSAADVYCLPGALGLSIVDAFYCGLPIITEDGDESPEIMYLKDGVNGFLVPHGDVRQLAARLKQILDDDLLKKRFAREAVKEINTSGHIDKMCNGFKQALLFLGRREASEVTKESKTSIP